MPPNFSSTREDGRRRVQAAGRSSLRCPLLSTASPVLQVRAAPSASLRLPAPSAQRRGQPPAPLLSCNASFPQLPLPPLPKAQRLALTTITVLSDPNKKNGNLLGLFEAFTVAVKVFQRDC